MRLKLTFCRLAAQMEVRRVELVGAQYFFREQALRLGVLQVQSQAALRELSATPHDVRMVQLFFTHEAI